MAANSGWLRPPGTLLLGLFVLTFASVSAVAWLGWTALEQERAVESQRAQEALEQSADRLVSTIRRTLAETGDRIDAAPPPTGAVIRWTHDSLQPARAGTLLYYPFPSSEPEAPLAAFAEAEQFEYLHHQPDLALAIYQKLADPSKPEVRAGALLRTARVLRRLGRDPRDTYRKLAALTGVRVAGAPAELVGQASLCAGPQLPCAAALRAALLEGRWRLTRGQFEFYWSMISRQAPPSEAMTLSELAGRLWQSRLEKPAEKGEESIWAGERPYLVIWRGPPGRRSTWILPPATLLTPSLAGAHAAYAVIDSGGRALAGARPTNSRAAVRTAAESALPWTLYVSASQPPGLEGLRERQRYFLFTTSIMVLFLILGAVLIARAIRREAGVLRMQSDFVSAVSHEFRSPLTSLRQLSELLALGRVPNEERRQLYYETLVKETTRLQHVVEALLNFGRMEAGARQFHLEELDAAQLVKRVIAEFQPLMAESGRHIDFHEDAGPFPIEADPDAICVALRNLLDNAIKYSPGRPAVWVECSRDRRRVAIKVRDEGPGVPESEREAIFGRFVRGSAARAANVKGSGVGLAMVRHIAAAHGGEISLASQTGAGSTFTLLLPAAEQS